MKDTAPISEGILAVAAVFGIIGGGVAYVLYDFQLIGAIFVAGLVAVLVAVLLLLGWRKPAAPLNAANAAAPQPAARAMHAAPTPTPAPAPVREPAPVPTPPSPAPVAAAEPVSAGEASRPAGLSGPRNGSADDLKQIKGVGPKLEKLLNSMGFWHFDQVANWQAGEIAWVDDNLEGFKGRVTRDDWVAQAKILAAGGETAFSAKVEKGGVY